MAYQKQNFKDGDTLYGSQLNHIEDGIVELEQSGSGLPILPAGTSQHSWFGVIVSVNVDNKTARIRIPVPDLVRYSLGVRSISSAELRSDIWQVLCTLPGRTSTSFATAASRVPLAVNNNEWMEFEITTTPNTPDVSYVGGIVTPNYVSGYTPVSLYVTLE